MKQLIAAIFLIVIIGIAGFLYRNALERPIVPVANTPGGATACTLEAKICPDGTSVGRSGPDCAFAACALPNAEDKAIGIAFVIPNGYVANADAIGADESLRAVFDKPSKNPPATNNIIIRDFPIPEGKKASDVMLEHTMYESSGRTAEAMSEFKTKVINGKTFYSVVLERFEGQVHSAYYLPRANDVLRFEVLERDVTNWSDASLNVETLPEHKALLQMLATLQTT